MAATMKDIARRTGLGLATISSYFNGGNVREKNRIKIEEAISELHYEVNEVARGLKTNATKTIGVVIPELNNTFCSEIITAMEDVLRNHGYATIICDCRTDKKLEKEAVEFLIRKRVDGLINMPADITGEHLKSFQKTGKHIPEIFAGHPAGNQPGNQKADRQKRNRVTRNRPNACNSRQQNPLNDKETRIYPKNFFPFFLRLIRQLH